MKYKTCAILAFLLAISPITNAKGEDYVTFCRTASSIVPVIQSAKSSGVTKDQVLELVKVDRKDRQGIALYKTNVAIIDQIYSDKFDFTGGRFIRSNYVDLCVYYLKFSV